MHDVGEGLGVLGIADRLGGNRVHGSRQCGVPQRAVIHVDQIVNPDPGQPLSAGAQPATQPGAE